MKPIIWLFIEGDADEKFFNKIIKPKFEKVYQVIPYKYSRETIENFKNLIERCCEKKEKFIITCDLDESPCRFKRKIEICKKADYLAQYTDVVIIINEIESWYLAGLPEKFFKKLEIKDKIVTTNSLTKEQFKKLKPPMFHSEINFMNFILERYDSTTACKKNASFEEFYNSIK